ncbi:MAG: hypothetical protein KAU21_14595 [Gammaproteobacteria bacterium]|nr:hypothetical protein [Gammaproteobacteria bacterium]
MHFLTKQFFSWLLVLMMVISPVQITMATDTDQGSHGANCQIPLVQISDIYQNDNCPMQYEKQCQEHPGCVAQFTTIPLLILNSNLSADRNITQLKFFTDNDVFLTHYPSLLKRPPKA